METIAATTRDQPLASSLLDSVIPILMRLSTIVVGIVAFVGSILYIKQESLLYFPEIGGIPRRPNDNPRGYRSPSERQLPFEEHHIVCSDGVAIHAWLILAVGSDGDRNQSKTAPTILFFHGNAGNIGLRIPNALQMLQYLQANIMMVEYRGYGNSDLVTPTEAGLKLDAEAALRFAHEHVQGPIFLFGRSLGGAVALHLAEFSLSSGHSIAGVMVENTFTSISAMVDKLLPFLTPIKPFVLKIGWDSSKIVPRVASRIPILFLAGNADELVPHAHMLQLLELAQRSGNLAEMHIIADGTHNESWIKGGPAYWDAIQNFMERAMQSSKDGRVSTTISKPQTTDGTLSKNTGTSTEMNNSIPIMSSRFIDIARDAVGGYGASSSSTGSNDKAQKKEL